VGRPAVVTPAVTRPTAAQRAAAALRAAAKAKAKPKVKVKAARQGPARKTLGAPSADPPAPSSSSALPYVFAAFCAALLLLGLAITPAWAVPWHRASRVLEDRRDELGVIGATSLVATVVFFLLVQVTK
jgi:hypothetical protein